MRKIYNNLFLLLALCLLAGCGVPQEEHDAMILQLQSEKTEIETSLNEKIAELESIVKAEKAKVKSHRLEMDNAERKIRDFQTKNAQSIKDAAKAKSEITSLKRSLNRAEDARDRAEDKVSRINDQLAQIQSEKDDIQFRFDQLVKNMNGEDIPEETPVDDIMLDYVEELPVDLEDDAVDSVQELTEIVSEMNDAATASLLDDSNEEAPPEEDQESSKSFFWFLGF
jgi:chromosome segregation ATPase